jgi:hypothetical protein
MRRSWLRRSGRPRDWTRTARAAADRHIATDQPAQLRAQLGRTDNLSGGFALETSVLARLLGIKLLTLEGVVFVLPAEIREPRGRPAGRSHAATTVDARTTRDLPSRTVPNANQFTREAPAEGRTGSRLDQAARLLDECSAELRSLGGG